MGDLDGNGKLDLLVTAQASLRPGNGRVGELVFLLMDTDDTVLTTSSISHGTPGVSTVVGDEFGVDAASAGDLDGDGKLEIYAGAYAYAANAGRMYHFETDYTVPANALPETPSTPKPIVIDSFAINFNESTLQDRLATSDAKFGAALCSLGDVDGDNGIDFAVGAPGAIDGSGVSVGGAVWIMTRTSTGTPVNSFKIAKGLAGFTLGTTGQEFGAAVAGIGDVNLDGTVDLVVGAPDTDRVFLLFLAATGGPVVVSVAWAVEIGGGQSGMASPVPAGSDFEATIRCSVISKASTFIDTCSSFFARIGSSMPFMMR